MTTFRFFEPDHIVWRCFSQVRDQTANENMTAFMQARLARDIEQWAASKASNPAFAQVCFMAARAAQEYRKQARARRV